MNTPIDYNTLAQHIYHQQWWFTPSECHGLLTALLCFKQKNHYSNLLFTQALEPKTQTLFTQLIQNIETALQSNDLNYQLLLPEDNVTLSQRAQALTEWAKGFLLATHHAQQNVSNIKLDEDCQEFLTDLQSVMELETNLPDSEDNQRLLTEVEEHCRMGALLLYATLNR